MKFTETQDGKEITLKIEGMLDRATVPQLDLFRDSISKEADAHVTIDASEIIHIDKEGVHFIGEIHRTVKMGHGSLKVVGLG